MAKAKVGIIGGSGLGDALCEHTKGEAVRVDTPFGAPSDAVLQARWGETEIAILNRHGPGHLIPPSQINYRANVYALKALGCTHVIASGAVGSLREHIAPKHLVIPHQVIDKTCRRAPTFYDEYLAAHVEFASPFCPVLRKHLLNCAGAVQTQVHDGGTYVCMEGPAFSTRAESEMHRLWGGDLIGMTCMPEAKLAREAELAYALVCLPSDYDCWRPAPHELDKHELLKEIIGNLHEATRNAIELIREAVRRFGEIASVASPAHSAMELAIWSARDLLPPAAKAHYGVLVEKYL
ncbi:MAG TPA: S-methyl-5'-thioadenosine phosphorylase [Phycisphaerales bacterium]|nr:S-methyl-5'-thioadenosine phosphorylase [Phycisphaerales bacterium]